VAIENVSEKSEVKVADSTSHIVAPAFVGLGVGILVGLSASPIVGSVIGGVLAAATAAIAILMGVQRPEVGTIRMTSLAWFTSLLVIGALAGIVIRAHNLLGPGILFGKSEITRQVDFWTDMGIDKNKVVNTLFAKELQQANQGVDDVIIKDTQSVLWANDIKACDDLFNEFDRYGTIKEALASSALSRWKALAAIEDLKALQQIVSEDLCPLDHYQWPWR
jgi:multisubunit Na+/H+ antiporter MnhB subunit